MNEFDFYDLKPINRNPVSILNKFADILPNNPQAYDFFADLMNGAVVNRNTPIGDVSQYIDLYDNRNIKSIKNFPDAMGKYYEKVLNAYDALANGNNINAFNQKISPIVNRNSILRGASSTPIGFSNNLIPDWTVGQVVKQGSGALLKSALNFANRVSPYLMIYEGLSQPTATDQQMQDMLNNYNARTMQNPVLYGGVEYNESRE